MNEYFSIIWLLEASECDGLTEMECLLVSLGEGEAKLDNWETYTQWSASLLEQKLEQEKVQLDIEAGIVMNEEHIRVSKS